MGFQSSDLAAWMLHRDVYTQMSPRRKVAVINTKGLFSKRIAGEIKLGNFVNLRHSGRCIWMKGEGQAPSQMRSGQVSEAWGSNVPLLQGHHLSRLLARCVSFLVIAALRSRACHKMMERGFTGLVSFLLGGGAAQGRGRGAAGATGPSPPSCVQRAKGVWDIVCMPDSTLRDWALQGALARLKRFYCVELK